jgi:hypothetical protein
LAGGSGSAGRAAQILVLATECIDIHARTIVKATRFDSEACSVGMVDSADALALRGGHAVDTLRTNRSLVATGAELLVGAGTGEQNIRRNGRGVHEIGSLRDGACPAAIVEMDPAVLPGRTNGLARDPKPTGWNRVGDQLDRTALPVLVGAGAIIDDGQTLIVEMETVYETGLPRNGGLAVADLEVVTPGEYERKRTGVAATDTGVCTRAAGALRVAAKVVATERVDIRTGAVLETTRLNAKAVGACVERPKAVGGRDVVDARRCSARNLLTASACHDLSAIAFPTVIDAVAVHVREERADACLTGSWATAGTRYDAGCVNGDVANLAFVHAIAFRDDRDSTRPHGNASRKANFVGGRALCLATTGCGARIGIATRGIRSGDPIYVAVDVDAALVGQEMADEVQLAHGLPLRVEQENRSADRPLVRRIPRRQHMNLGLQANRRFVMKPL